MKLKPGTRTRLNGYLAIAVTTLLTPGGKLISSAVAAATVVGLVGMNIATQDEKARSSTPVIHPGTGSSETSLLNVSGLTGGTEPDMLTPDALGTVPNPAPEYAPQGNQAVITPSTNIGSVILASSTIDALVDGPHNPQIFFPPKLPDNPPEQKCTPLAELEEAARKGEAILYEVICEQDKLTTKDPVVETIIATVDVPQGEGASTPISSPEILALAVEPSKDFTEGDGPPSDPPKDGAPPTSPKFIPLSLAAPLDVALPLDAAAIPEPSTLAMLLLGLTGLGWVYRRKQD